jgi:hypothetical protein
MTNFSGRKQIKFPYVKSELEEKSESDHVKGQRNSNTI